MENVGQVYAGSVEATISKKGLEQIELLAKRLSGEKIDYAFCSDLRRSIQTTSAVLKHHHIPLESTPLLREKAGGIYDGRPFVEWLQACETSGLGGWFYAPPEGESFHEVEQRAATFIETKVKPLKEGVTVLVSAHGGFNMAFLSHVLNLKPAEALELKQQNTCVNELFLEKDGSWQAMFLNCIKHLAA